MSALDERYERPRAAGARRNVLLTPAATDAHRAERRPDPDVIHADDIGGSLFTNA
jgi:hypothetical protein